MEKAYIILAHRNMEQLNRLLDKLNDEHSYFFVHIDAKLSAKEFAAFNDSSERIKLIERINIKWADFSLVEATLGAMRAISVAGREFHTITLLSGQDYPIKTNESINHFFENAGHNIFMEYYRIPNYEKWSPRGGLYRVDKYFFGLKEYQLFTSRVVNFLANIFPVLQRKQPAGLIPYAGSQWWTIDMYALNYILNFVENNPLYNSFHKATFAPDEIFFHTIILNAKDERIKSAILNNNKRFIRWKTSAMSHPELLQGDDISDICNSDALYARKLDLETNQEVFDLIDEECLKKETVAA